MGSPNFYTGTNLINLGYVADVNSCDDDNSDCDCFFCEVDTAFVYEELKSLVEGFKQNLPTLFWHDVVFDSGYYKGYQLYIEENTSGRSDNRTVLEDTVVSDWNNYKTLSTLDGYEVELGDCPYFNSNAKNVTATAISRAMDREYKLLHNLVLEFGKENGFGEIVGHTWTSSLSSEIESKKFRI